MLVRRVVVAVACPVLGVAPSVLKFIPLLSRIPRHRLGL